MKKILPALVLCLCLACRTAEPPPLLPAANEPAPADSLPEQLTRLDVPWKEVAALPATSPDTVIAYGSESQQFGELRLPPAGGPHPVVVFIHGGCWLSQFDLRHVGPVSADLARRGYAVWTPEYRRVGDEGGGWPGTFLDIGRAVDYLRVLAESYPLDLNNITVMGHSAGGHLALWQALRPNLPPASPLYVADPLPVNRVIALAAITDLGTYHEVNNSCSQAVAPLMGGEPHEQPERYRQGNPGELLPSPAALTLIHGDRDAIVPIEQAGSFVRHAQGARLLTVDGAGHFDMVFPSSRAWGRTLEALAE